jgi:hypothetical protein
MEEEMISISFGFDYDYFFCLKHYRWQAIVLPQVSHYNRGEYYLQWGPFCIGFINHSSVGKLQSLWLDIMGSHFMRRLASFFSRIGLISISKVIWRRERHACGDCGRLVGMDSMWTNGRMVCINCYNKIIKKEERNENK